MTDDRPHIQWLDPAPGNAVPTPMKPRTLNFATTASFALAILMLLVAGPACSQPTGEVEHTIDHLFAYVSASDLRFVRNASIYTPSEAAAHMEKKYRHFRDDIETAEDFIALCATKSLVSGKPYRVVDPRGNEIRTSDWLRAELAAWQARHR
jgi:hypothetical protein